MQQLGRGASKIVLDGGTGSATIPGTLTTGDISSGRLTSRTSGGFGTARCVPDTTFGESTIGFYRNGNSLLPSTGDFWAVGHNASAPGDRHFGIGRNNTNLCLSIPPTGVVNILYSLTVGGVAAQRIPYVSCRVDGGNVNNRGGQVVPTADASQTGRTILTMSPPHPAGGLFYPQVTLISNWCYIYVDSPFTDGSLSVWTANSSLSFRTLSFLLIL